MSFTKRERGIEDDFALLTHNELEFREGDFLERCGNFEDDLSTKDAVSLIGDFRNIIDGIEAKRYGLLLRLQRQFEDLSLSYESFLSGGANFSLSDQNLATFNNLVSEIAAMPSVISLKQQAQSLAKISSEAQSIFSADEKDLLSATIKDSLRDGFSQVKRYQDATKTGEFKGSSGKDLVRKPYEFVQAKFKAKIEASQQEIVKNEGKIKEIKEKDEKPFFRRALRFFTGGKYPAKADVKKYSDKIDELQKTSLDCTKKSGNLGNCQNFELGVEESLSDALKRSSKLFSDISQDGALKTFFAKKQEVVAKKDELKQDVSASLKKKVAEAFSIAILISEGKVKPKDGKSSTAFGALETIAEFASIPVLGQVVGVSRLIFDFVKTRQMEKGNQRIIGFSDQEQQQEVVSGFIDKLIDSYLVKSGSVLEKLDKDSLDVLSKQIIGKMIKGVASKAIVLDDSRNVDDLINDVVDYVRSGKTSTFKLGPKEAIKVEDGRRNVKYTAQGAVERMAVEVENDKGEKVVLTDLSRQVTDEKYGEAKYGVRQATEQEQQAFLTKGAVSGYAEFKPLDNRLEERLGALVGNAKTVSGDKDQALDDLKALSEKYCAKKSLPKDEELKEDLAKIIAKGKRGRMTNKPDADRVVFNQIKGALGDLVENKLFKENEKSHVGKHVQGVMTQAKVEETGHVI